MDKDRLRRRAQEARHAAARLDSALLDTRGIDRSLHDLTLAKPVLDRLDDAYRHELGNAWLLGLRRARSSGSR